MHEEKKGIDAYLPPKRMASVLMLKQADSTNTILKKLASEGAPAGQVVIADTQTRGRGRRGRFFYSPGGTGIYLSYLLRPQMIPSDTVTLTAWTAVAAARGIKAAAGVVPGIKWVNDLMMEGRKICGILTELVADRHGKVDSIIIGIGVNVNRQKEEFPEELRETATSLEECLGRPVSREALGAAVVEEMDRLQKDWPAAKQAYLEAYRSMDITAGRDVMVLGADGPRSAKALCINDDFSLEVAYPDGGREALNSGEVSLRITKPR